MIFMSQPQNINTTPIIQKISYLGVILALVLVLAGSAYMKLSNNETIVNNFLKWNLIDFKNYIAFAEILGIILLIIPRTTIFGVLLLSGILSGAVYTHIQHTEPFYFPLAIILVIWINYLFIRPKKTA
jgi:carbon starvation protein CstA